MVRMTAPRMSRRTIGSSPDEGSSSTSSSGRYASAISSPARAFCPFERERLPELLRVRLVPGGIEGARVAHQLVDAHPAWEIVFLRQIADARQDRDRFGNRIEAEHAHRSALRAQQTQNMFDERRF